MAPVERIVLVGACAIDTILNVPHYPAEDEKLRAQSCRRTRGGNTANTAEVLQQLLASSTSPSSKDIEIYLINVLPARNSPDTRFIAESLGPRVNLEHCIYREDHTDAISCYIISSAAGNSRTIITHNELPEMTFEEFRCAMTELDKDPKQTWVHFEGRIPDVTLACLNFLTVRNSSDSLSSYTTSVEMENPRRPGLEELIEHANVVFYSKVWAQSRGFQTARECLIHHADARRDGRCQTHICTWGADGSYGYSWLEASSALPHIYLVHAEAQKVNVVDPVGAGDTFLAAMIFAMIDGGCVDWEMGERLGFANRVAAKKLGQEGFGNITQEELGLGSRTEAGACIQ